MAFGQGGEAGERSDGVAGGEVGEDLCPVVEQGGDVALAGVEARPRPGEGGGQMMHGGGRDEAILLAMPQMHRELHGREIQAPRAGHEGCIQAHTGRAGPQGLQVGAERGTAHCRPGQGTPVGAAQNGLRAALFQMLGADSTFQRTKEQIAYAVRQYGLPEDLKLSVHSGSDKFSIYPAMARVLRRSGAGVHLKTAGTTWLEELIGLAEAGGEALDLARQVYAEAYAHREELCGPYAAVIDIDEAKLPPPDEVNRWSSQQYAAALRHDQACPLFNLHVRQLLHVGYKVAAKMGERYLRMLEQCEKQIAPNVTGNLYERHIKAVMS